MQKKYDDRSCNQANKFNKTYLKSADYCPNSQNHEVSCNLAQLQLLTLSFFALILCDQCASFNFNNEDFRGVMSIAFYLIQKNLSIFEEKIFWKNFLIFVSYNEKQMVYFMAML